MVKKKLLLLVCMMFLVSVCLQASSEGKKSIGDIKFGAHVKGPVLYDTSWGTSKIDGVNYDGSSNNGFGFPGRHMLMLFISKDINETTSIHIAPDFANASAGATPSLGKKIGEQQKAVGGSTSFAWFEAYVKKSIPEWELELRAGYMNVPFTQDYGRDLFWHEEMNASKFSLYAGSWHGTGIEAYRNFELSDVSLPVYLYLLNGSGGSSNRDNNKDKTILLHVEPEFSCGLKTFLSYGFGKWGDQDWDSSATTTVAAPEESEQKYNRWSVGTSYDYRRFSIRAEMAQGHWDNYLNYNSLTTEQDKDDSGYGVKLFYKLIQDKLTAMVDYSLYERDTAYLVSEEYKTTILGLQYELAESMTYIVQFDIADWKNNEKPTATAEDSIKYNRLVMGIRTTF